MLLRPVTSALAARIQQALDPERTRTMVRFVAPEHSAHQADLAEVQRGVYSLLGAAGSMDPGEVWAMVRDLDSWALQATVVALLHMRGIDARSPMASIKALDPNRRTHPAGGSVAAGLAAVIPTRASAHGLTSAQAFSITDEAVGL